VLPTELLSGSQARELEPDLSPIIAGALLVPVTGIVDSHALMNSLEKDIMESTNASLVFNTSVVRVDPYVAPADDNTSVGWVVQLQTRPADSQTTAKDPVTDALLARTVITSTGLSGTHILNSILPPSDRIPAFYARGSYLSYRGPGVGNVKRLIYPCPDEHIQSLGTHLTLDLSGNVRFGPDLEYIEPPAQMSSNSEEGVDPDFWQAFLSPSIERIQDMHAAITSYLPNVTLSGLQLDYAGIRPKLIGKGGGLADFVVRCCYADSKGRRSIREEGLLIALLGIESPGLTSSLAIAEMIVEDILKNPT
jgi:2-hydroxyglutarate dehydrogenase